MYPLTLPAPLTLCPFWEPLLGEWSLAASPVDTHHCPLNRFQKAQLHELTLHSGSCWTLGCLRGSDPFPGLPPPVLPEFSELVPPQKPSVGLQSSRLNQLMSHAQHFPAGLGPSIKMQIPGLPGTEYPGAGSVAPEGFGSTLVALKASLLLEGAVTLSVALWMTGRCC